MAETNTITHKACAKCKSVLALSMFNKNKSKRDGLGTECRPCANSHSKKYHAENLEAHKERLRENYRKNPGKHAAGCKDYVARNREKVRLMKRLYRQANPDASKEYSRRDWEKHAEKRRQRKKEYRALYPEKGTEQARARQTRKVNAFPAWADREKIKAIYAESRRISLETGIKHHVDHYYPLVSELVCGLHCEFNLRVIPAKLNQAKHNHFPDQE